MIPKWLRLPTVLVLALLVWASHPVISRVLDGYNDALHNFASTAHAEGPITVKIAPDELQMAVGVSDTIAVHVGDPNEANHDELYGAQVHLSYDENIIALSNYMVGPLLSGNGLQDEHGGYFTEIVSSAGAEFFTITLLNPADPPPMLGDDLAHFDVECLAEGTSQIAIVEDNVMLSDRDSVEIEEMVIHGNVVCGDVGVVTISPVAPDAVRSGKEFDVIIQADNLTQESRGSQLVLQYNSELLELLDTTLSGNLQNIGCLTQDTEAAAGQSVETAELDTSVGLAFACGNPFTGSPVALWVARFQAKEVAQSTDTMINVTGVTLSDENGERIPAIGTDTIVRLVGGKCGDLNGDSIIDILDAVIDLLIAAEIRQPTLDQAILGDVLNTLTNPGINVGDVILILKDIVSDEDLITDCGFASVPL